MTESSIPSWWPLLVAVVLEAVGLRLTWRLIWPAWKRVAKPAFYLTTSALLTWAIGSSALVFIVGHPLVGAFFHSRFCRNHGFNPWRVEDTARYVELQKRDVAALAGRRRRPPDE